MTLNTRNKLLLSLFVLSISFFALFFTFLLVNFIKGNFSLIPKLNRLLPIESESFLLKNSPIASILSILAFWIYIPISCYFLYTSFEKTKSPETVYLMGFFIACMFQAFKVLIVLLKLWNTSSQLLILIARIETIGRILAPICLLFTALFSEQEQEADKNFGLALGVTVFCACILPINTTRIFSNFTLSCGFDKLIYIFIFLCAFITCIAFIITSKQRELSFLISPSPYYILMFLGYITLTCSDCFLMLFIGITFLTIGSYGVLSRIHKYYLWK